METRRTTIALLEAMASFVAVCIGIGVYFDLVNGRFSGAGFLAEILWIAGRLGPLLVGGVAALKAGDRLRGAELTVAPRPVRIMVVALAFASGALATAVAIHVVLSHAPDSVAAQYSRITSSLEAASGGTKRSR
ncbi:MAG TPA: hypothetical protein VGK20_00355 [Candidatus Binatia bacterium]